MDSKQIAISSLPSFIASLEATMILLSIPSISTQFDINHFLASAILSVFIISEVLFCIPFSLLAEKVGLKKIIITGTFIMAITSFMIVLTNNYTIILLERVLQGAGSSMVILSSLAYASMLGIDNERGKAIGINHTIVSLGYVAGLPLGGIVNQIDWKDLFLITTILSLVSIALLNKISELKTKSILGINSFYIMLIFAGILMGLYYYPFFIIAITGFILSIKKVKLPRNFMLSSASGFTHSITRNMLAVYFILLLYSLNFPSILVGFVVLLFPFSFTAISFISGKMHDKLGIKIALFGFLGMIFASLLLYINVFLSEIGLGLFSGIATTSNTSFTMSSLDKDDRLIGGSIRAIQGVVTNSLGLELGTMIGLNLFEIISIIIIFNFISEILSLYLTSIISHNK